MLIYFKISFIYTIHFFMENLEAIVKTWLKTGFGYFFLLSFFRRDEKREKNNLFVVHLYA